MYIDDKRIYRTPEPKFYPDQTSDCKAKWSRRLQYLYFLSFCSRVAFAAVRVFVKFLDQCERVQPRHHDA